MHRLTQNLRNTQAINLWLSAYLPKSMTLKSRLTGGLPVGVFPWQDPQEEKRLIQKEVGRLISQGIRPKRIVLLSPNTKEKSSLADTENIGNWPIGRHNDSNPHAVRYATIRSFKGLEADIVFLIGLKEWNQACTPSDVYVGASRARFLLHVFHHQNLNLKP
jgi:superfamily I DNA/RNA helicase